MYEKTVKELFFGVVKLMNVRLMRKMEKQVRFSFKLIVAAFFVLTALVVASIMPAVAGASSAGFPMYSWGGNASGQLGLGDSGDGTQRLDPTRVGEADNWVQVAVGSHGSFAINDNGELFGWGNNWTTNNMGQGAHPSPGAGNIVVPTRIGTANNWTWVAARNLTALAINSDGHLYAWGGGIGNNANVPMRVISEVSFIRAALDANTIAAISDQGYLYTWGANTAAGWLGNGTAASVATPTRIGDRSGWADVSIGGVSMAAVTEDGHLYTWGSGSLGQLGLGDTNNRNIPTRVGMASNWTHIGVTTGSAAAAVNSDGHLYTWGSATNGQLGNGTTTPNVLVPTRVGTASNWNFVTNANSHFLAFNDDSELWSWGNNASGQLGIGELGGHRSTPQLVLQVHGFTGAARGGGHHSVMLLHTEPVDDLEIYLTKYLTKPQGTDLLGDITFTFNFERYSFNGNTALSNQVPQIPNRTITLNNASSSSTAAGITTTTDSVNVLENIEFTQAGVFAWRVTEAATTVSAPSSIVDSQAEYMLRVYVSQEPGIGGALYIYTITIHRLYCNDGEVYNPPYKTDDFSFTNIYTRTTTGSNAGALVISKNVTGPFADLTTVFNFEVTITKTAMCPEGTTFVGQTYGPTGPVGNPITFTSGATQTINLTHGQRIVFDEFLVGTRFSVTELAAPGFIASVNLVVDGNGVAVPGNTNHNQDLSIGGPHIAGSAENSAAFTNAHNYVPTGLSISNTLTALPFIAATGLIFLLASKYRKRIEQLPLA